MISLTSLCVSKLEDLIYKGKKDELKLDPNDYLHNEILDNKNNILPILGIYDETNVLDIIKQRVLNRLESIKNIFSDKTNCLLSGQIQSGKTQLIIASSWWIQFVKKSHNIVVLRNITSDVYQFKKRITEFNINFIKDPRFFVNVDYIRDITSINDKPQTIVCLLNSSQLNKACLLLHKITYVTKGMFHKNSEYTVVNDKSVLYENEPIIIAGKIYTFEYIGDDGKSIALNKNFNKFGMFNVGIMSQDTKFNYHIQIDEVDVSKKSKQDIFKVEKFLKILKSKSKMVIGYTATGLSSIINDDFNRVVKMPISPDYVGIADVNFEKVSKEDTEDNYDRIYKAFIQKDHGIMLHNTTFYTKEQFDLAVEYKKKCKDIVFITQNGKGITVLCNTDSYAENLNKTLQKKYKIKKINEGFVHRFKNIPISKIIQFIKDENLYTHIVIIARVIASRGMSYVSDDYKWHITDQIYTNTTTTSDSLLQAIRCCGIWKVNKNVTLWTTSRIKKKILNYYNFMESCINAIDNNSQIDPKETIQNIPTVKPITGLYKSVYLNKYFFQQKVEKGPYFMKLVYN